MVYPNAEKQLIPAVDILDGRCVRLRQGDFDRVTDYGDPVELAETWARMGSAWLHIVDLTGARTGRPEALEIAANIRRKTDCRLQYGGGLRSVEAIRAALDVVDRVIVSSWALRDPMRIRDLAERDRERVLVSLDLRDGKAWIAGWGQPLTEPPERLARSCMEAGAAGIIVTEISRDGTLEGVDPESIRQVTGWGVPFWWAGGIATLEDVRQVFRISGHKARGVIVGRALYEGTLSVRELVELAGDLRHPDKGGTVG